MSTREMAYSILDRFSQEELERFIAYFSIIYPVKENEDDNFYSESNMKHLDDVINKIENGTSKLTEHDLIEVDYE